MVTWEKVFLTRFCSALQVPETDILFLPSSLLMTSLMMSLGRSGKAAKLCWALKGWLSGKGMVAKTGADKEVTRTCGMRSKQPSEGLNESTDVPVQHNQRTERIHVPYANPSIFPSYLTNSSLLGVLCLPLAASDVSSQVQ